VKLELGRASARRNNLKPIFLKLRCDLSDECGEVFILEFTVHRTRVHAEPRGDVVAVWMTPEEFAELHTELGHVGTLAGLTELNESESR
jgi:hypothetical protein